MDDTAPHSNGDGPGEDEPRRAEAEPSADVLSSVATRLTQIEASSEARIVLAQILTATLVAFSHTGSVRDPLPDTAPNSPEEALAVLAGIDHLRASLAALDATWQVTAEQRIRHSDAERGVAPLSQGKGASHEIALARRITPAASSFSLASARRLTQHMPRLITRLWEGSVTAQQASTVAGALSTASPATCERLDEIISEAPQLLSGKGHKRLREDVDEMIQTLEPETSRQRAERAARERHVTMTPLADGMARVSAVLRGIDAVGLMQTLNSQAESLRAAGEKASVPALEADLLVDAVLHPHAADAGQGSEAEPNTAAEGSAFRRPRPTPCIEVGIVITDTALLGRDDDAESARLEGYGVIPAHIVSDTLLGRPPGHLRHTEPEHPDEEVSAFYRRLYASPSKGELIAMESRSRAFPAGLARMIRWRDTTCRTPWCNAKIRQSDHVIPHHRGGPTSYANGQGLCVRCNLLKEHGLWAIVPLDGTDIASTGKARRPPRQRPVKICHRRPGSGRARMERKESRSRALSSLRTHRRLHRSRTFRSSIGRTPKSLPTGLPTSPPKSCPRPTSPPPRAIRSLRWGQNSLAIPRLRSRFHAASAHGPHPRRRDLRAGLRDPARRRRSPRRADR
ncbi:HNH endonuclease signature motif containing protein [Brachybacterium paraconglomeratum]|uniref:HNH endonuclease n=1 Tax=Brachybacterium paraconglomeratum TaxID=173362 RepID=UPI0031EBCE31